MSSIVSFMIVNKNNNKIDVSIEKTIKELRNILSEHFNIKNKFCKIEFLLDFPIRKFGILTLNPGELTDVYDNEKLNRFNIENKTLNINVYFNPIIKKKQNKKKYVNRFSFFNTEIPIVKKNFVFNEDDFPPL